VEYVHREGGLPMLGGAPRDRDKAPKRRRAGSPSPSTSEQSDAESEAATVNERNVRYGLWQPTVWRRGGLADL
jgi:hypothetical protein